MYTRRRRQSSHFYKSYFLEGGGSPVSIIIVIVNLQFGLFYLFFVYAVYILCKHIIINHFTHLTNSPSSLYISKVVNTIACVRSRSVLVGKNVGIFVVIMGSFDGSKTCVLIGAYLLHELSKINKNYISSPKQIQKYEIRHRHKKTKRK